MMKFLIVFMLTISVAHALLPGCATDADCKIKGPRARCVPQKTNCPGKDAATSTCVVRVCDNTPVSTKFPEFVQKCDADSDCALILLKCQCMYCARAGDVENRIADSINKKYMDLQKEYACTPDEMKHCALVGPCADVGKSVPVCKEHLCTLRFEARH